MAERDIGFYVQDMLEFAQRNILDEQLPALQDALRGLLSRLPRPAP